MNDRPEVRLPRFTRLLLRVLCPRNVREDVEGDLLELRARREMELGSRRARARLHGDRLSLCGVLILGRIRAGAGMSASVISGRWAGGLPQALRYAARLMRRQPAFSLAVVLTLALGIGTNAAIFSVVHAVLFKDLPYEAGDRFVAVRQQVSESSDQPFFVGFNSRGFLRLAERQTALERIAAVAFNDDTFTGLGEPERLRTMLKRRR